MSSSTAAEQKHGWLFARMAATVRNVLRWLRQWVPFALQTMGYATVSVLAGPFSRGRRASAWAQRSWSRTSLVRLGIRSSIAGEHNVPGGGFIYASNHQSLLDILVLGAVLPGDIRWVLKRSVMRVPFLGWHLRLAGHVAVDRGGGRHAAKQATERFCEVVAAGKPLLIFPEGTRTTTGEVGAFKNGCFVAAVRSGCPVVPVALEGTGRMMAKGATDSGETEAQERRHVRVRIGKPLRPVEHGDEASRVDELRERCRAAVVAMHAELRADAGASRPPAAEKRLGT